MKLTVDRIKVVLNSIVTRIGVATAVAAIVIPELVAAVGPDNSAVIWLTRGVAVLVGLVEVIRRVTPVLDIAVGLLPADGPVTPGELEQ